MEFHKYQKELQRLQDAFEFFDNTHSGTITMEEFRQAIMYLSQYTQRQRQSANPVDGCQSDLELLHLDSQVDENAKKHAYDTISTLSTNEDMLLSLFHGIDFNNTGYIDYSEFLAACLARKEGLKREYAELIFELYESQ